MADDRIITQYGAVYDQTV